MYEQIFIVFFSFYYFVINSTSVFIAQKIQIILYFRQFLQFFENNRIAININENTKNTKIQKYKKYLEHKSICFSK